MQKSRSQTEPHLTIATSLADQTDNAGLYVGPAHIDHDIDGLELSHAAQVLGMTIDEVWKRVRNGLLVARTVRGKVLVYADMSDVPGRDSLPPPPVEFDIEDTDPKASQNPSAVPGAHTSLAVGGQAAAPSQELALLIDHLSLAKDENREILRLTQDSMARLTQMTDAILQMKDTIIANKEEQMSILKQRLAEQADELTRILKEKEDLETLAQALQAK